LTGERKMKKILVVFLLFVSGNLFAQKQEIGRITWQFQDYNEDFFEEDDRFPEETYNFNGRKYKSIQVWVDCTIPAEYLTIPTSELFLRAGEETLAKHPDAKWYDNNLFTSYYRNVFLVERTKSYRNGTRFVVYAPYCTSKGETREDLLDSFMFFEDDTSLSWYIREKYQIYHKDSRLYQLNVPRQVWAFNGLIQEGHKDNKFTVEKAWSYDDEEASWVYKGVFTATYIFYKE
jgi:hypothetical protein